MASGRYSAFYKHVLIMLITVTLAHRSTPRSPLLFFVPEEAAPRRLLFPRYWVSWLQVEHKSRGGTRQEMKGRRGRKKSSFPLPLCLGLFLGSSCVSSMDWGRVFQDSRPTETPASQPQGQPHPFVLPVDRSSSFLEPLVSELPCLPLFAFSALASFV